MPDVVMALVSQEREDVSFDVYLCVLVLVPSLGGDDDEFVQWTRTEVRFE